jgi:hypothetical protein
MTRSGAFLSIPNRRGGQSSQFYRFISSGPSAAFLFHGGSADAHARYASQAASAGRPVTPMGRNYRLGCGALPLNLGGIAEWRLSTLLSRLSARGPRSRRTALTVLELALQQHERIGSHVGVKQCAVPVVSFAAVKHQPVAHRGKRLTGAWETLREQDLRANVALLSVGALAPLDHLGPGELIIEEILARSCKCGPRSASLQRSLSLSAGSSGTVERS